MMTEPFIGAALDAGYFDENERSPLEMVESVSEWQRVIHGASLEFRRSVTEIIEEVDGEKRALRYAMCGRGDRMDRSSKGQFRMVPSGCNERLCPRCSRKRGMPFLQKVFRWLEVEEHGEIWHVVLTQEVRAGEVLEKSFERLRKKWRVMHRWLKKQGLTAGLLIEHVKWSRYGGWHVHQHCMLEFSRSLPEVELSKRWLRISEDVDDVVATEPFVRLVVEAGGKLGDKLDGKEPDLWNEGTSEVVRALQYPMRDALQGVSSWIVEGAGKERIRELYMTGKNRKFHRALGRWRKAPEESEKDDEKKEEKGQEETDSGVWSSMGTMDNVASLAASGVLFAVEGMRWLEKRCRNNSDLGKRIVEFARFDEVTIRSDGD